MDDSENNTQGKPNQRGNPGAEKPYCWQSKAALRAIRAAYGNDTRLLPYLMSTYLALCEVASDEGRPVFTKSISEILVKAGGSYRKLSEVLSFLARLGLLRIQHNFTYRDTQKGKAPSTYTLLTTTAQHAEPLGTVVFHSVPIEEKNANAKNEKESTRSPLPIPGGYSFDEQAVIAVWHDVVMPAGLGFLPVDERLETVVDAIAKFPDPDHARTLFEYAVELERSQPSRKSKSIVRILEDNYVDGYWSASSQVPVNGNEPF